MALYCTAPYIITITYMHSTLGTVTVAARNHYNLLIHKRSDGKFNGKQI